MWKCKMAFITAMAVVLLLFSNGCIDQETEYEVNNEDYIILRLAESESANYPSTQADAEFARLVEQKSNGRIIIKIYDSGQLGDETSVVEQVHFGGIDLARVDLSSLTGYVPEIEVVTLPYIFEDAQHMWNVIEGTVGEVFKQSLLQEKIVCLCWFDGGAKHFFSLKQSIMSKEDLQGYKINLQYSQNTMDAYAFLGVTFVPTEPDEVYSALEIGALDGIEDNIIAYYNAKYYELVKHVTFDAHSYIPEVIIASRIAMLQLSKSDQELIEQAAEEAAKYQKALWAKTQAEVLGTLKGLDITIYDLNESQRQVLRTEVEPLYKVLKLPYYDQIVID